MTQFHMDLEVHDKEALYQAARKRAISEGHKPANIDGMLRPEGEVSVSACLVMLLDPGSLDGASINESWVDPA